MPQDSSTNDTFDFGYDWNRNKQYEKQWDKITP